jgi:pimeloyl-ACP methyl ester carboxylesterase
MRMRTRRSAAGAARGSIRALRNSIPPTRLAYIRVPILVLQGAADPYGTLAQVRVLEEECYCPVEAVVLDGVGHAPHREDLCRDSVDNRGLLPAGFSSKGVENAA